MALAAGDRLASYEILAPIGAGTRGEVYRAHDILGERDVVIEISVDPLQEDFARAARAAAVLDHPRIRALYSVGPDYLAMEAVEGVPLKGPLSLQESLRFSTEICDALVYAQERGVCHGNLTPSNVLITRQGVKLLNFGFARAQDDIRAFGGLPYEML